MDSKERLINKFLTDKTHITVEDCEKLLTAYGYEKRKSGGSHIGFHKKGAIPVIVITPKHTKYVISPYINKIIKILGLEE